MLFRTGICSNEIEESQEGDKWTNQPDAECPIRRICPSYKSIRKNRKKDGENNRPDPLQYTNYFFHTTSNLIESFKPIGDSKIARLSFQLNYTHPSPSAIILMVHKVALEDFEPEIGARVELVIRRVKEQGDDGLILYAYKFRPAL